MKIPGQAPAIRTYTLSTATNPEHYRLQHPARRGRRAGIAVPARQRKPGFHIEAMSPRGKFVCSRSGDRPVVLISGGVGITPMIAMAEHIVAQGRRTGMFRPVRFIHGAQSGKVHAFRRQIGALVGEHPDFKLHVSYSRPGSDDVLGESHHGQGVVSIDTIKQNLSFGDYEFYLCGPAAFMKSLYDGLTGMGVPVDRIFYESFGPATVLKPEPQHEAPAHATPVGDEVVPVRFVKSDAGGEWSREHGTLLEFAEAIGVAPSSAAARGSAALARRAF